MRRSTQILLVVTMLGVMMLASGCGRPAPAIIKDATFARDVLDALYAGSLAPLGSSLDPVFAHAMTDQMTAATGTLLADQFGAVKDVQFQSMQEANPAVIEAVWTVTAGGSDFEMMLWVHKTKLSGIWIRPSPDKDWGPVPQIGVEYTRHQRSPAGW